MDKKYFPTVFTITLIIGLFIYFHWNSNYDYRLHKREKNALQNNTDIHIAAVWHLKEDKTFLDGVKLAINETNADGIALKSNNTLTKAKIILHEYDDSTEENAQDAWLSISETPEIVSVLGHSSAMSAIPASISYEYNGILFISAITTHSALTQHQNNYTLSINPSNPYYINKLLDYAKKQNLKKLIILREQNEDNNRFYQELMSQLDSSFKIINSYSFTEVKNIIDIRSTDNIYRILSHDFDAVVLITQPKNIVEMLTKLRAIGITQPILGSQGFDQPNLLTLPESVVNNVILSSVFPEAKVTEDSLTNYFIDKFKLTYGYTPSYFAFQGYESVKILTSAYSLIGTTLPISVATTLKFHYANGYHNYVFNRDGLIKNKPIYLKSVNQGQFKMVNVE